jgi:hypothetical protein
MTRHRADAAAPGRRHCGVGRQLFIGGQRAGHGGPAPRGLAYNPVTNQWRLLPPMAFPRSGFAAVWTGRQLLVWDGYSEALHKELTDGAVYTPAR